MRGDGGPRAGGEEGKGLLISLSLVSRSRSSSVWTSSTRKSTPFAPPLSERLPRLQGLSLHARAEKKPHSYCCDGVWVQCCTGRSRTSAGSVPSVDAFFSKRGSFSRAKTSAQNFVSSSSFTQQRTHTGPRPDRAQCRPDRRGQERVAQRPVGAQERLGRVHAQVRFSKKRERLIFFQWFRRRRRRCTRRAAAAGSFFFPLSPHDFSLSLSQCSK